MSIVRLDIGTGSGPEAGAPGEHGAESEAAFVEALRLRSAEALERAYGFLAAQSDEWALLRADVLCQARPATDLIERIAAVQASDGSIPLGTLVSGGALGFPAIDAAGLDPLEAATIGTLEALLLSGDARALHAAWVEPAARFLEARQAPDGAFRIPASAEPGAEGGRDEIFWTGMIAGILGRTPVSRPSLLDAAGEFLGERFDPEQIEHEGYPALMAYGHFFTNVAHDLADEALQWCGRALEKGFRSRQLDGVATLRVLLTCDAQALPGATFEIVELLERVLEEQAGDGGFAELSLGGPSTRTTQTFDGMLAIVRLCSGLEG